MDSFRPRRARPVNAKTVTLLAGSPGEGKGSADMVLRRALAALGKAAPTLAYLGCASGESVPFRLFISRRLKAGGCGRVVNVDLGGRRPDLSAARSGLDGADAVFVSGGDVELGMAALDRHGLSPYLRSLAGQGKPFIGLSAGSIMLGRSWIRWRDPLDDASAEIFPCLAVAPLVCDTHDEADGWTELQALLRLLPEGSDGWGIPSGGDLLARPDGTVTWTGRPPAHFRSTAKGIESV